MREMTRFDRSNPYRQYMYSYPHKTAYGALTGIHLSDYLDRLRGERNSLYIHLPFCQYKCGYCNLFSIAGADRNLMEAYVMQMERQAAQLADVMGEDIVCADLTLGGGTPLLLDPDLLERIFHLAEATFHFDGQSKPVIVETSPRQTTREKLECIKEHGTNRISIGVQSFQEQELESIHRFHSAEAARQALEMIQDARFDCVNIDIIYGIPGQTEQTLLDSLGQALTFRPEELFVYPLYVKPGTRLYREGLQIAPDALGLYRRARNYLQEAGYVRKSMRRFVRKDYLGRDGTEANALCGFDNTISLGCGGRSYVGNLHFCTPYAVGQEACQRSLEGYLGQEDFLTVTHGYLLDEEERKRRYAVKHLLYDRGICRQDYREHFGREVEQDFPMLTDWQSEGFVETGDGRISLTEEGMDLSDCLGPEFISEKVAEKMSAFTLG